MRHEDVATGVWLGIIGCLIFITVLGLIFGFPQSNTTVICDYLGGEVQGEVCIKDSVVIYKGE